MRCSALPPRLNPGETLFIAPKPWPPEPLRLAPLEQRPTPGQLPPLGLYVHFPWCVRKCPYCDFNSHTLHGELPEAAYIEALLSDLRAQIEDVQGREVVSLFF